MEQTNKSIQNFFVALVAFIGVSVLIISSVLFPLNLSVMGMKLLKILPFEMGVVLNNPWMMNIFTITLLVISMFTFYLVSTLLVKRPYALVLVCLFFLHPWTVSKFGTTFTLNIFFLFPFLLWSLAQHSITEKKFFLIIAECIVLIGLVLSLDWGVLFFLVQISILTILLIKKRGNRPLLETAQQNSILQQWCKSMVLTAVLAFIYSAALAYIFPPEILKAKDMLKQATTLPDVFIPFHWFTNSGENMYSTSIGILVTVLFFTALFKTKRVTTRIIAITTLALGSLSFGPVLRFFSTSALPLPYSFLEVALPSTLPLQTPSIYLLPAIFGSLLVIILFAEEIHQQKSTRTYLKQLIFGTIILICIDFLLLIV